MERSILFIVGYLHAWQNYIFYALAATLFWAFIARIIGSRTLFILLMLPGTFLHECQHYLAGGLTNAKPSSFSIIPDGLKLGSVGFTNITWYNAIPAALAPLVGLISLSILAIHTLPADAQAITGKNLLILLALSPLAYACWPSFVDWKLSLRGWPVYAGGIAYLLHIAG